MASGVFSVPFWFFETTKVTKDFMFLKVHQSFVINLF